jgi:hypothetical protein
MSDRFTAALAPQSEMFRTSLEQTEPRFLSREEWGFWKSMLTAALVALVGYGWASLTGALHR